MQFITKDILNSKTITAIIKNHQNHIKICIHQQTPPRKNKA